MVGKFRLDLKKNCLRIVKQYNRLPGIAEMLQCGKSSSGAVLDANNWSRASFGHQVR